MPELPEVETVRRRLLPHLIGSHIERVELTRSDVLRRGPAGRGGTVSMRDRAAPRWLLEGAVISSLHRHGKQLAIEASDGRVLVIHLGMSGRLWLKPRGTPPEAHSHARWILRGGGERSASGAKELTFVDPRRFGGLRSVDSMDDLRTALWSELGPDALTITADELESQLLASRRPLKSLLLDQCVIAGIGNIYADEILFDARLDPRLPSVRAALKSATLVSSIRSTLESAVNAGGSTIRDYVDPSGAFGTFQSVHRVYGRGGLPCVRCREVLVRTTCAGRTTVLCRHCQARVIHKSSRGIRG